VVRAKIIAGLLLLATIWPGLASSTVASDDTFKIVVHPANPVTEVSREFLRDAFLRKAINWEHGAPIRPIDLAPENSVRDRFTREILGKTPSQLRSYWAQRIFSGTAVPPTQAESPAAAVGYVAQNTGAVTYVPSTTDVRGVKVIEVE